jgi:hypothetical protein
METDFKVYKRKIYLWVKQNSNIQDSEHTKGLIFFGATYASPTCKAAIARAKELNSNFDFVANFAKD